MFAYVDASFENLYSLWSVLKSISNERNKGLFIGLVSVDFNIDNFETLYHKNLKKDHKEVKGQVAESITQVIEELDNSKINYFHRSCAANFNTFDDVALCIHYSTFEEGKKAISLPGINFLYSRSGLLKSLRNDSILPKDSSLYLSAINDFEIKELSLMKNWAKEYV